jgi:hypothetical protein
MIDKLDLLAAEESPYLAVARIVVNSHPAWFDVRSTAVDNGMAFSP